MSIPGEKLSAYLDGELSDDDARAVEAALAADPALQAEFDALVAADDAATADFAAMLDTPVPAALAAALRDAPDPRPVANDPAPRAGLSLRAAVAACALFLAIGGAAGFWAASSRAPSESWLADIADYHAVYAAQGRHRVEVPASEAAHIAQWLTASVGAEVRVPDLTDRGLTFEGARLLVANGKPVSQLIYTDAAGTVVALCAIASPAPAGEVATRIENGFEMVSWGGRDANFVVIGPEGYDALTGIAESAASRV